ncbi:MAG: amino acid permease, partial [Bifidobacterium longum]
MAAAGTPKDDTGLERKMESRHLTMISLGGVIGTGLFVSSGYAIHQAGPLGAILAYAAGSLLVYCVMVSLGELSVAMPYAGSFHMYAKRFIGPGTAFTIAILYWLNWAVALASEFTAAGLLMQRWFPHSPSWVWSAVFIVVVFAL